ncbi:MAG: hypothetical protein WCV85_01515 [Patescibacteria group bacterium]|jgi:hypothetical protein
MNQIESPEAVRAFDRAIELAQKYLRDLEESRLQTLRQHYLKQGLRVGSDDLGRLCASNGGLFVPRPHTSPKPQIAEAPNGETAYYCDNGCGWVKGVPEDDPSGDNLTCIICAHTVGFRR